MGSAQVQGALWGGAAQDWAELVEPSGRPAYDAVFAALGIGPGTELLDVGCGAGLALVLAQDRGARVAGLDASENLLAIARDRLPGAELHQGDVEELPFADGRFDAVTSFNAVQYASDPVAALREVRRVCRPGALAAVVVWGDAERCETRSVLAAIGSLLPPPPPGAGGPFALSAPGAVEDLLVQAGLTPKSNGEVEWHLEFPDLDTAARAHASSGPGRRAIDLAGADAVGDAVRAALSDTVGPDGWTRQRNVFRYVVAVA